MLATEVARGAAQVGIRNGDPNRSGTTATRDGRIVVVDLEGVASRLVSRAISQADLVLIPMRATTLDATIGVRALALIEEEVEALGRPIRHAVVFTMTRAIRSKQHTAIEASLRGQGVDVIMPP